MFSKSQPTPVPHDGGVPCPLCAVWSGLGRPIRPVAGSPCGAAVRVREGREYGSGGLGQRSVEENPPRNPAEAEVAMRQAVRTRASFPVSEQVGDLNAPPLPSQPSRQVPGRACRPFAAESRTIEVRELQSGAPERGRVGTFWAPPQVPSGSPGGCSPLRPRKGLEGQCRSAVAAERAGGLLRPEQAPELACKATHEVAGPLVSFLAGT